LALPLLLICLKSSGAIFLVSTGATWKYLDDGSNQGTAWRATNFNDSAWLSGPAELGFGDMDEATPIRGGYITAYFRHYFTVQNPQDIHALTVGLRRDDGGVVYLNGTSVFASNMRDPPFLYDSLAFPTSSETAFFTNAVNPQILVAGTNVLAVEIHQSAPTSSDLSFDLWLEAGDNVASTVTLTAPPNNSGVRFLYPFSLAVDVSSPEGVMAVDFYADGEFVDSDTEAPYEVQWVPNEFGPLSLIAVGILENGLVITSAPVVVTVVENVAPTASIATPPHGSVFGAGSSVFIGANANDSDGSIVFVRILTNGFPLIELTDPPYNFTWDPPSGNHVLQAMATDNDGASVTSSPVNIFVESTSLYLTIATPANNSTVALSNVIVEASVFDSGGVLAFADFFMDGVKVGSATNAPFKIALASVAAGSHTLFAVAVDNSATSYYSQTVSFFATDPSGSILRGPYLQSCTTTSTIVRWRTDISVKGVVRFGTNAAVLNGMASEPGATTEHAVLVYGLSPNTRYFYSVGDSQRVLVSGSDCFFVTAPALPRPTRIWAIGDFGTGEFNQIAVRDAYFDFTDRRYTDVWLLLGDNAYGGGRDDQYQTAVFDMYSPLLRQTCVWPTIGNHDVGSGPRGYVYTDIFSLPANGEGGGVASGTEFYYSYDYGDIHFVVLDSQWSSRLPGSPMLTWLQEDLDANLKRWTIAYWHHPPYTRGTHDSEQEYQLIEMRENVLPILEAYNVDLVLTGHSHVYERSFLLNGHYGYMTTLTASMVLDGGSGRTNETGAYRKSFEPNQGTVYAVVGCSGQIGGGSLDHPANFISLGGVGGSLVVDVDGDRLDAKFLSSSENIVDTFTMIKSLHGPPLTIMRTSTEVAVSWPVTTDTYVLEMTANLSPPVSWSIVTNAVQQEGSRRIVHVPSIDARQYFRLRK
jgi:hypothetical protein